MKVYGLTKDFVPVRQDASRTIISFDVHPVDDTHSTWEEVFFYKKQVTSPSIEQIKDAVRSDIDKAVKAEITEGFVWEGVKVPLKLEDQTNYKRALDLAVQTKSANLPVEFWFGTQDDPKKHVFKNVADLRQFWLAADKHINECLAAGHELKASIDWSQYETPKAK